jgi:iron complex outermembrane receptor protein
LRLVSCTGPAFLAFLGAGPNVAAQDRDSAAVRVAVVGPTGPLAGARVRAAAATATTARDGVATIRLGPGTHTLSVARIGFRPDSVPVILAGRDTSLTVRLEPVPVELDEVRVETARSNRRIEDQPLRVEVLEREEVEEKLLMTPGDVAMMLNESGGLRVQNTSPSLGGANVRVQGLRGRYTLVLADGLPLYGSQVGGLGLLQVPPMDLGRVEVIKGAASALYGSSALGGVINLLSRRPDGSQEALLNGTTLGGTDLVAWTTSRGNRPWAFTLLAGGHRQGRADRDGDGWTDVPGYRRLVARPRAFWTGPGGESALITAGVTLEGREGGTLPARVAPDGRPFAEELVTTRWDLGVVAHVRVAARWDVAMRASTTSVHHRHRFGAATERDRHATQFGEVAASHAAGGSLVVLGLGFERQRYRSRDFPSFDYSFDVPGLFGQVEWNPRPVLTVSASARLDRHNQYGTFVKPRLSALVRPGGPWTVRVSAGTGYHAPTPFTEETEVTGLAPLTPLTDLGAEVATGGTVDVAVALGSLELNGTLFGSVINGAVQRRPAAAADRFELANAVAPTRTIGGELLARFRGGPWHLTATYTYARSTESDPITGTRRAVPLTPSHALGVVAAWESEGRTRIGAELYYTGRQELDDNPYRAASRPYVVAGGLIEHRIGRLRVFVNLENLTNVRQTAFDPLVLPARASDGRWTTDAWAPLEGRVINGGVRWSR